MDCAGFWNKIKSKTFWYLGLYWICGFDSDYSGQSLFKFLGLYWFSESLPTFSKILFVIRVFSNSLDCIGLVNLYRRFSKLHSFSRNEPYTQFWKRINSNLQLHKLHLRCSEADHVRPLCLEYALENVFGDRFFVIQLRARVRAHHPR